MRPPLSFNIFRVQEFELRLNSHLSLIRISTKPRHFFQHFAFIFESILPALQLIHSIRLPLLQYSSFPSKITIPVFNFYLLVIFLLLILNQRFQCLSFISKGISPLFQIPVSYHFPHLIQTTLFNFFIYFQKNFTSFYRFFAKFPSFHLATRGSPALFHFSAIPPPPIKSTPPRLPTLVSRFPSPSKSAKA